MYTSLQATGSNNLFHGLLESSYANKENYFKCFVNYYRSRVYKLYKQWYTSLSADAAFWSDDKRYLY